MSDTAARGYSAFLLRVSLGISFLAYGYLLKVLHYTPAGTADYFASIGYPAMLAYAVIAAEIVGGLLLLVGFGTRWAALALVPIMLGATLEHAPNGWVFSVANGGWSYPAFWTATLLVQALLGDGIFALGPALDRWFTRMHSSTRAGA